MTIMLINLQFGKAQWVQHIPTPFSECWMLEGCGLEFHEGVCLWQFRVGSQMSSVFQLNHSSHVWLLCFCGVALLTLQLKFKDEEWERGRSQEGASQRGGKGERRREREGEKNGGKEVECEWINKHEWTRVSML